MLNKNDKLNLLKNKYQKQIKESINNILSNCLPIKVVIGAYKRIAKDNCSITQLRNIRDMILTCLKHPNITISPNDIDSFDDIIDVPQSAKELYNHMYGTMYDNDIIDIHLPTRDNIQSRLSKSRKLLNHNLSRASMIPTYNAIKVLNQGLQKTNNQLEAVHKQHPYIKLKLVIAIKTDSPKVLETMGHDKYFDMKYLHKYNNAFDAMNHGIQNRKGFRFREKIIDLFRDKYSYLVNINKAKNDIKRNIKIVLCNCSIHYLQNNPYMYNNLTFHGMYSDNNNLAYDYGKYYILSKLYADKDMLKDINKYYYRRYLREQNDIKTTKDCVNYIENL